MMAVYAMGLFQVEKGWRGWRGSLGRLLASRERSMGRIPTYIYPRHGFHAVKLSWIDWPGLVVPRAGLTHSPSPRSQTGVDRCGGML